MKGSEGMRCDKCRHSIVTVGQIINNYEDVCAVSDDSIAKWDISIGTDECKWYMPMEEE